MLFHVWVLIGWQIHTKWENWFVFNSFDELTTFTHLFWYLAIVHCQVLRNSSIRCLKKRIEFLYSILIKKDNNYIVRYGDYPKIWCLFYDTLKDMFCMIYSTYSKKPAQKDEQKCTNSHMKTWFHRTRKKEWKGERRLKLGNEEEKARLNKGLSVAAPPPTRKKQNNTGKHLKHTGRYSSFPPVLNWLQRLGMLALWWERVLLHFYY